ncbi:Hypothetical_protein [Hexamita inflata]|uniref:Hypothetical_protein n=1 Tax=Hexamita inflata TaxID=28002 RepID=A0ABP1GEG1_9EUKA
MQSNVQIDVVQSELLHYLTLKGGVAFSTPLQVKCIRNVSKNYVELEQVYGEKTLGFKHMILSLAYKGLTSVQPPCKRVDPYKLKCPLLSEVIPNLVFQIQHRFLIE